MGERWGAYKVSVERTVGKRPLGRPRRRLEGNTKTYVIFKKCDGVYGLDWSGSGYGQVTGSCKCGNEPSGSIKRGEFMIGWGFPRPPAALMVADCNLGFGVGPQVAGHIDNILVWAAYLSSLKQAYPNWSLQVRLTDQTFLPCVPGVRLFLSFFSCSTSILQQSVITVIPYSVTFLTQVTFYTGKPARRL